MKKYIYILLLSAISFQSCTRTKYCFCHIVNQSNDTIMVNAYLGSWSMSDSWHRIDLIPPNEERMYGLIDPVLLHEETVITEGFVSLSISKKDFQYNKNCLDYRVWKFDKSTSSMWDAYLTVNTEDFEE